MGFDPYLQWLQIPPDRRPPSHHELLGLPPDETDRQRIEEAAVHRYQHVRKYALGPQGEEANRLLNEISQAVNSLTRREPGNGRWPQSPLPEPPPVQGRRGAWRHLGRHGRPSSDRDTAAGAATANPGLKTAVAISLSAVGAALVGLLAAWPRPIDVTLAGPESPATAAWGLEDGSEWGEERAHSAAGKAPTGATDTGTAETGTAPGGTTPIGTAAAEGAATSAGPGPTGGPAPAAVMPPGHDRHAARPPATLPVIRLEREKLVDGTAEVTFRFFRNQPWNRNWALGPGKLHLEGNDYEFGEEFDRGPPVRRHEVPRLAADLGLESVSVELEVLVNGVFLTVAGVPRRQAAEALDQRREELELMKERLQVLRSQWNICTSRRATPREKDAARRRLTQELNVERARPAPRPFPLVDFGLPILGPWDELFQPPPAERIPPDWTGEDLLLRAGREIRRLSQEISRAEVECREAARALRESRQALDALRYRCREVSALVYLTGDTLQ